MTKSRKAQQQRDAETLALMKNLFHDEIKLAALQTQQLDLERKIASRRAELQRRIEGGAR